MSYKTLFTIVGGAVLSAVSFASYYTEAVPPNYCVPEVTVLTIVVVLLLAWMLATAGLEVLFLFIGYRAAKSEDKAADGECCLRSG